MIDLAPRIARLEALRGQLPPESHEDLALLVAFVAEAARRESMADTRSLIAALIDQVLTGDIRRMPAALAVAAAIGKRALPTSGSA